MKSYAIVQASGKQFWIEENRFYDFDKLPLNKGDTFHLNKILLVNKNNKIEIGKPFLDKDFIVEGKVLRHLSGQKIRVYKMRPKKKTRKTFGSRQKLTRIYINEISKQTSSVCYL
jgi:large subunit ribosomal protein L21